MVCPLSQPDHVICRASPLFRLQPLDQAVCMTFIDFKLVYPDFLMCPEYMDEVVFYFIITKNFKMLIYIAINLILFKTLC